MWRLLLCVIGVLGCAVVAWPHSDAGRILLPWGYIDYGSNEVTLVSTVHDPPKWRLAATAGGSLGAVTFSRMRADGRQEEVAIVQGKEDERYPESLAGEITIHLRQPNMPSVDAAMRRVMLLRHDGVEFDVPVSYSRRR